jgi:hypothetical protein
MGEWRYSSTILDLGTRWGVSGQLHAPAVLPPAKLSSVPFDMRLGGPQSRCGCYGEEENLASAWNRTPTVEPVAHYRLSYPDS